MAKNHYELDEEEMEALEEQISVGIFRLITSSVCISNGESQSSFMKLKLQSKMEAGNVPVIKLNLLNLFPTVVYFRLAK